MKLTGAIISTVMAFLFVVLGVIGAMLGMSGVGGVIFIALIFVTVAILLWVKVVKSSSKPNDNQEIREKGIEYVGKFISSLVSIVGTYKVKFSCEMAGEIKEFETDYIYSRSDIKLLQSLQTFKVKVYKNMGVVTEDLNAIRSKILTNQINGDKGVDTFVCAYCGCELSGQFDRCPHCGAAKKQSK